MNGPLSRHDASHSVCPPIALEFLMRIRAAALFLALLAVPAAAQAADTGIADQARTAYAMYAGGLSQDDFSAARYGKTLFTDIAGNWVRLNGPDASGIETYGADTEKFCQTGAALTLSS